MDWFLVGASLMLLFLLHNALNHWSKSLDALKDCRQKMLDLEMRLLDMLREGKKK